MQVICYGDSSTYGYDPRSWVGGRYEPDSRWVDILAAETGAKPPPLPWQTWVTPIFMSLAGSTPGPTRQNNEENHPPSGWFFLSVSRWKKNCLSLPNTV